MQSPKDADVGELLRRLCGAGVEFIVVGGAAAVLHGAPITTEDLDSESIADEGAEFLVVDLPTSIELKIKTGRAKDRLMLPVLIAHSEQLGDACWPEAFRFQRETRLLHACTTAREHLV